MIDALRTATEAVCDALERSDLLGPSLLPGWSRLTIACHLRYGAEALQLMTLDALDGKVTSYYPLGRAAQRDGTLAPRDGESPGDVVASLRRASDVLHDTWDAVDDWSIVVREPADNVDLGDVPLRRLALARLTEVEVHGTDLDAGLGPWSETLVAEVLPMRLEWLNVRRSNHRAVDESVRASWLLRATDAPLSWRLDVDGADIRSAPSTDETGATVVEARAAELLAMLLGRALAPAGFAASIPGP